jgi:aspartyl-tRNA(Asn)/glutamyl-tRNA(Gln) amidotransferase subunit A
MIAILTGAAIQRAEMMDFPYFLSISGAPTSYRKQVQETAMKPIAQIAGELETGATTSRALTEQALARISDPDGEGPRTFIRVFDDAAVAEAEASDRLRDAGVVPSPLAGIPVSIKDLCDVAGITTLAGSVVRRNAPPAARDATILARLRAAGAVIMGTTNMTEFACGGLGLNPHYGDCRNPHDRETGRVPGGSSAGAAISVTDGMAAAAVGTDTAGSVRIPAAMCGLAGFKPTARRVPTDGVFPLSTTLDSVGPLAPTIACCAVVDAIFAGEDPALPDAVPLDGLRFGIPDTLVTDDLEPEVAAAFDRAVDRLSRAGARIEDVALPELGEMSAVGRVRFPSMVEGYAIHRDRLENMLDQMDPRISERLLGGGRMSGPDYYDVLQFRQDLIERTRRVTAGYDAIIMPTLPVIAPLISRFKGSHDAERDPHIIVIRNTVIANMLDRCSLTVPCHEAGAAPVGFMLMGEHMADKRLLGIGLSVDRLLSPHM